MKPLLQTIIIDDEMPNRKGLGNLLQRHCPEVTILGEAASAAEAQVLINALQPNLLFLDIKMPGQSGLDLLRGLAEIPFDVIFVSAFDEYAIQAFEFNTVDYILKPIDYTKLISAVKRAAKRIQQQQTRDNLVHFVSCMNEREQLMQKIMLHQGDKVHVVDIEDIVYIEATGNYSRIVTRSRQNFSSAKTLSDYEALLTPFPQMLRINKQVLINAAYVAHYTKGQDCFIRIKGEDTEFEVSRRKKTQILNLFRELVK
jgi:two-component system LytT family response regulator